MSATRKDIKIRFEQYLRSLELQGIQRKETICPYCSGDGEELCPHCGDGMIECEYCKGRGKVLYPDFEAFEQMYRNEAIRYEMWLKGEALHKIDQYSWPTLSTFILEGRENEDISRQFIAAPRVILRIEARAA